MSTVYALTAYAAYIIWRAYRDHKIDRAQHTIDTKQDAIIAEQQEQSMRLKEIEATLQASPFVTFPTLYKP